MGSGRASDERGDVRVPAARVLLVEADVELRSVLASALRSAGFTIREAASSSAAERLAREFDPDVAVVDRRLPDADGLAIARALGDRDAGTAVIIVADRNGVSETVAALAVADDYVVKPIGPSELVARVQAVLRRTRRAAEILRFADVELDEARHEVRRGGRLIELTPREFDLLRFFMLNPNRVLGKAQILDSVWTQDFRGDAAAVETYVSYLRKKLGPPQLIKTVRLVGYALREPS